MVDYSWNFQTVWLYREALIRGAIVTVQLTVITIVFGTPLGVLLAFGRMARNRILRWPSITIIEIFRGLPLLVLLIWIYYCVPIFTGIIISAYVAASIGLSLNLAAFAAEVFRAGVEAIPIGYIEAARALGMTGWQTTTRILLPQAARQMLPPMVGLYITMLKLSSLASVIAVTELLHAANDVNTRTYRPLEIYTAIAFMYLVLVLPGTILSQRLEAKALFRRPVKQPLAEE